MKKRRFLAFVAWILATLILAVGVRLVEQSPVVTRTNNRIVVC